MTQYTSLTIVPPGTMGSIQSIVYDSQEIAANADGSFTLAPIDSVSAAQYLANGWTIEAFTK